MKVFIAILIVLAIVIALALTGLVFYRNELVKNILVRGAREIVDQKITVGKVAVGLGETDIKVTDLKVYNPYGYTETLLAEAGELYFDYSLKDIIKGFFHFSEIRLQITQINVEKDSKGRLNIDHFKPQTLIAKKKDTTSDQKEKKTEFLIDKLEFSIGKISYRDDSFPLTISKTIQLNYSNTFNDVCCAKSIIAAIRMEVIKILVAEGIILATNTILTDKNIQKALEEGDIEALKDQGEEKIEEIKAEVKEHLNLSDEEFEEKKNTAKKLLGEYLNK